MHARADKAQDGSTGEVGKVEARFPEAKLLKGFKKPPGPMMRRTGRGWDWDRERSGGTSDSTVRASDFVTASLSEKRESDN
jgi:hypothetical protein